MSELLGQAATEGASSAVASSATSEAATSAVGAGATSEAGLGTGGLQQTVQNQLVNQLMKGPSKGGPQSSFVSMNGSGLSAGRRNTSAFVPIGGGY